MVPRGTLNIRGTFQMLFFRILKDSTVHLRTAHWTLLWGTKAILLSHHYKNSLYWVCLRKILDSLWSKSLEHDIQTHSPGSFRSVMSLINRHEWDLNFLFVFPSGWSVLRDGQVEPIVWEEALPSVLLPDVFDDGWMTAREEADGLTSSFCGCII